MLGKWVWSRFYWVEFQRKLGRSKTGYANLLFYTADQILSHLHMLFPLHTVLVNPVVINPKTLKEFAYMLSIYPRCTYNPKERYRSWYNTWQQTAGNGGLKKYGWRRGISAMA